MAFDYNVKIIFKKKHDYRTRILLAKLDLNKELVNEAIDYLVEKKKVVNSHHAHDLDIIDVKVLILNL